MDRFIAKTLIFILCVTSLVSCSKNMEPEKPTPPASLLALVEAYNGGKIVDTVSQELEITKISFTDGSVLNVPFTELRIRDCRKATPPSVGMSPGAESWSVGGILTGIPYTPDYADNESLAVYAYYDEYTIHLYLSNGNILIFKSRWEELKRRRVLPVVKLYTDSAVTSKENYVNGRIEISDSEGLYGSSDLFTAPMKIRGRGNSTWGMPKKPYKIKLESKASILGMPADKEWALLANYADKTLLRNVVAMELSRICGFSWTPRMVSVEVYMNDSYQGVYTLCEHKKVSSARVNIDVVGENDNDSESITGGYYLEIEQNMDETTCFYTSMGVPMMFSDPEIPSAAQLEYVKNLFTDYENALRNANYSDTGNGCFAYIDEKSFIDNYIVQELTKNIDGNLRKSTFLTKEKGKKLEMYHLWDFDLTLGNCDYFQSDVGGGLDNSHTGFFIRNYSSNGKNSGWYYLMFKDKDFTAKVRARWDELMPQLLQIPDFIREQAFILEDAQKRNFKKWDILGTYVWPNAKVLGTYDAEVNYLIDFYSARLEWLDARM